MSEFKRNQMNASQELLEVYSASERSFLQLVLRMVDIASKLTVIGLMAFGQICFGWHISDLAKRSFAYQQWKILTAFNSDQGSISFWATMALVFYTVYQQALGIKLPVMSVVNRECQLPLKYYQHNSEEAAPSFKRKVIMMVPRNID